MLYSETVVSIKYLRNDLDSKSKSFALLEGSTRKNNLVIVYFIMFANMYGD